MEVDVFTWLTPCAQGVALEVCEMDNYELAYQSYKENKFEEALSFFCDAFWHDELSEELRIECGKNIVKICELLKSSEHFINVHIQFADLLVKNELFAQAAGIYKKVLSFAEEHCGKVTPEVKYGELLHRIWFASFRDGQLEDAWQVADQYIEYLYQKRNSNRGLEFLEEITSSGWDKSEIDFLKIRFLSLVGDIQAISKLLEKYVEKYLSGEGRKYFEFYRKVENELDNEQSDSYESKSITELLLISKLLTFILNQTRQVEASKKKDFVNLLYRYFINEPVSPFGFMMLIEYSLYFKKKYLLPVIESFSEKNRSVLSQDRKLKRTCNEKLSRLQSVEEEEAEVEESVTDADLSEDLFIQEEEEETEILQAESKPVHPDVEDVPIAKSITEIENMLVGELSRFVSINEPDVYDLIRGERGFLRLIETMNEQLLFKASSDLIVVFLQMEMPKVALAILDRVEDGLQDKGDIKTQLEYSYLRVNALLDDSDPHAALVRVDEVISIWPLKEDERKCFLYLKAEILRSLKQDKMAREVYGKVQAIDPNYRLVEYRLKEFE